MIVRDESIEFIHFSIPYAVIPVSFYIINENNCVLNITENNVAKTYTFPQGNYTANYFISQFPIILGSQWSVTLNQISSVFTIKNSLYAFTLLSSSTIKNVIGFSIDTSSTSSPFTLVLPRICNFFPLPRVTIRCSELANCTMVGNSQTSDVLITIPNNSRPNGQIYYQNQTQAKLLFRGHHLARFVLSFTDDDGNNLNFNGISSFFTFQFDIYRRTPDTKLPRFSNIIEYVSSRQEYIYPGEQNTLEQNA
jgi:hypothetical protein